MSTITLTLNNQQITCPRSVTSLYINGTPDYSTVLEYGYLVCIINDTFKYKFELEIAPIMDDDVTDAIWDFIAQFDYIESLSVLGITDPNSTIISILSLKYLAIAFSNTFNKFDIPNLEILHVSDLIQLTVQEIYQISPKLRILIIEVELFTLPYTETLYAPHIVYVSHNNDVYIYDEAFFKRNRMGAGYYVNGKEQSLEQLQFDLFTTFPNFEYLIIGSNMTLKDISVVINEYQTPQTM